MRHFVTRFALTLAVAVGFASAASAQAFTWDQAAVPGSAPAVSQAYPWWKDVPPADRVGLANSMWDKGSATLVMGQPELTAGQNWWQAPSWRVTAVRLEIYRTDPGTTDWQVAKAVCLTVRPRNPGVSPYLGQLLQPASQ